MAAVASTTGWGFPGGTSGQKQKQKPCLSLQETWVTWARPLGWEDLLEEEMVAYSRDSCLENPMDGGAWGAIVHGVAKG